MQTKKEPDNMPSPHSQKKWKLSIWPQSLRGFQKNSETI